MKGEGFSPVTKLITVVPGEPELDGSELIIQAHVRKERDCQREFVLRTNREKLRREIQCKQGNEKTRHVRSNVI